MKRLHWARDTSTQEGMASSFPSYNKNSRHRVSSSGLGTKRKHTSTISDSETEEEDTSGCSDEELELAITSR